MCPIENGKSWSSRSLLINSIKVSSDKWLWHYVEYTIEKWDHLVEQQICQFQKKQIGRIAQMTEGNNGKSQQVHNLGGVSSYL